MGRGIGSVGEGEIDFRFRASIKPMLRGWADAFRPRPKLSTAEWIQRHVVIPPEIGANPGPYSISGREYLLGPMQAIDDPEVEEIVLKWPTQVGKTTFLQAVLQSRCDTCPAPGMLAGPDQDEILKLRDDFYRMAEASSRLRKAIPPERLRNDRHIEFSGLRCYLAWAGNTQRLAGKSCQFVLSTEIDKWAQSLREGNSQALVRNRVKAWFRFLLLWESTPTDELSPIADLYEKSNKCTFQVPCPHCGHHQALRFYMHKEGPYAGRGGIAGIQLDDGSYVTADEAIKSAYYICEQGCRIDNEDKAGMVARGVWVPEGMHVEYVDDSRSGATGSSSGMPVSSAVKDTGSETAASGTRRGKTPRRSRSGLQEIRLVGTPMRSARVSGFHMTSLVSATISFGKFAAAWLDAKDDDRLMQDFVNNWLAEKWVKKAKVPKWDKLYIRLKGPTPLGHCPPGAFFLTCGSDVQSDRCYYVIRAWGEGATSWLIDRGCCLQAIDPSGLQLKNSDLNQLDETVLNRNFPLIAPNAAGMATLQVRLLGVDCNFETRRVWDWVRTRNQERVRAIAGDSSLTDSFYRCTTIERSARDGKPYEGGLKRWGINTVTFKTDIHQRWAQPLSEPGAWFLSDTPREHMETYLRQVTNEGPMTKINKKGRPETVWVVLEPKTGNHYWDCEVYARALADMVTGGDFTNLAARSRPVAATRPRSNVEQEGFAAR